MATVTVYTAERMKQIEDNTITAAEVIDGRLILGRYDGSTLDAGPTAEIDLSGYVTQEEFIEQGPSGRELARAESIVQQTNNTAAQVNITGLEITFEVVSRPVMVEGYVPWATNPSACTLGLAIRDGANTDKRYSGQPIAAGGLSTGLVREHIDVPGVYTRRLSFARTTGTGTITNNANLASVVSVLRAIEQ